MTSRTPCLAGLRPLSCSCLLTIWVAPENRLAKLRTPRTYCFTAGFSGAPNGVRLQSGRAASGTAHNPGSKLHLLRDAGFREPLWIVRPTLRQVQTPTQNGGALRAHLVQTDSDLAVCRLAQRPGVLACYPNEGPTCLRQPSVKIDSDLPFCGLAHRPGLLPCSPTECSPCFGNPVSSITHIASGSSSLTIRRANRSHTGCHSHGLCPTNCCIACSLPSGNRFAIGSTDFRSPSNNRPRTYTDPQCRRSLRPTDSKRSTKNCSRRFRHRSIWASVMPKHNASFMVCQYLTQ